MIKPTLLILLLLGTFHCLAQDQWQNYSVDNGLASNTVSKYLVRNNGEVWMLTGHTVNVFNGTNWTNFYQITDALSGDVMDFEAIVYMKEDPNEHVWLGSKLGLFEFDGSVWKFHKERWNKKFGHQGFHFSFFSMDAQGYNWAFLEKTDLFPTDFSKSWTIGALHRFNGTEWENYTPLAGGRYAQDTKDKDKYYKQIRTDKKGNFWIITYDGFRIWDGESWQIHNRLKESTIDCLVEDLDGNTWIGNEYGLLCYRDDEWTRYTKKDGLSATWVYFLHVDETNRVWAFSKGQRYNKVRGLDYFKDGVWTNYTQEQIPLSILSANHPGDGKFWLGCLNGIVVFDGTSWKTYTEKDGLLEGKYNWIIKDKYQNIWASNNKFLMRFNNEKWEPYFQEESKEKNWLFNVKFTDSRGDIWLGTRNKGIFKLDGDRWINYNNQNGLSSNQIKKTFEDKQGNVWLITGQGVSVYHIQTGEL